MARLAGPSGKASAVAILAAARCIDAQSRRAFHECRRSLQLQQQKAPAAKQQGAVPSAAGAASAPSMKANRGGSGDFDFRTSPLARHQMLAPAQPAPPAVGRAWTPASRRVGVLALKCGMTADWDTWGARRALTVLKLENVVVTGVATEEARGYTALQVGAGAPKIKNVAKPQIGKRSGWKRARPAVMPCAVVCGSRLMPRDSRLRSCFMNVFERIGD